MMELKCVAYGETLKSSGVAEEGRMGEEGFISSV